MAEKIIQNPSITSGDFSFSGDAITAIAGHPVAGVGGGGTQSDYVYVPSFNDQTGDITFTLDTTASEGKGPWHISGAQGPQGPQGPSGTNGTNGTNGENGISPTFTITPTAGGTHITISGAQGEDSFDVLSGAKGADGTAGFSPTVSTTTTASEDRTGTVLTFTYGDEGGQTVSYTAWNGKDGTGATVDLLEGTGIHITHAGNSYTIGVSADYYALKSELPDVTDIATKTWVGQQGYLTSIPDSYATKTYVDAASAEALSQAKSWTNLQNFATSAGLDATKQYAMTTAGWAEIDIPAVGGEYLPLSGGTVSGDVIVKSTGKNLLAVNTTATLMGQSRVNNLTDTTAIGTNWLGVNSNGGGFLKNVQGGNVGDLNGTSIQINFAPDGANSYGSITVNSQDNMSKVVHVPTASYDSMTTFDPTNGPNYMLRKTASGFDIGAKVVNVTSMPQNTEANTYYFVYEV